MTYRFLIAALFAALLSACATPGYRDGYGSRDGYGYDRGYDRYDRGSVRCYDCGRVINIERYYGDGRTTGAGAITGAIVGGALGSQVGSGDGRRAATVAGAVVGGLVGNEVERDVREGARYDIHIQMDNGRRIVVSQRDLNGVQEGSYVRVDGGRAYRI